MDISVTRDLPKKDLSNERNSKYKKPYNKVLQKKLDSNYTRMLRAILNKFWRQNPTKQQLYGHLLPITKTIQIKRTRHARHCWRNKDEFICDIILWTATHERVKVGRPTRTYIKQRYADTGCNLEDLLRAMDEREDQGDPC